MAALDPPRTPAVGLSSDILDAETSQGARAFASAVSWLAA